jgi:hypothetical protein
MVFVVGMVLSLLKASDGVSLKTASVSQQRQSHNKAPLVLFPKSVETPQNFDTAAVEIVVIIATEPKL